MRKMSGLVWALCITVGCCLKSDSSSSGKGECLQSSSSEQESRDATSSVVPCDGTKVFFINKDIAAFNIVAAHKQLAKLTRCKNRGRRFFAKEVLMNVKKFLHCKGVVLTTPEGLEGILVSLPTPKYPFYEVEVSIKSGQQYNHIFSIGNVDEQYGRSNEESDFCFWKVHTRSLVIEPIIVPKFIKPPDKKQKSNPNLNLKYEKRHLWEAGSPSPFTILRLQQGSFGKNIIIPKIPEFKHPFPNVQKPPVISIVGVYNQNKSLAARCNGSSLTLRCSSSPSDVLHMKWEHVIPTLKRKTKMTSDDMNNWLPPGLAFELQEFWVEKYNQKLIALAGRCNEALATFGESSIEKNYILDPEKVLEQQN